jgi:hypothetical protein
MRGDRLGAVLEIYGSPGLRAGKLAVHVEVKAVNGGVPGIGAPASLTAIGASSWRARADVNLEELAPGPYVVSASITLPDGAVKKVERGFLR